MKGDQALQTVRSKSKKFWGKNSATILTCLGAIGSVATVVTAIKATPKALDIIEEAKNEKGEDLTKLEIAKATYKVYIPTVVLGASSVACIFGANVMNKKQQATLVSAYAMLDNSYKEYKKKVSELYGEDANQCVAEEISKDHYKDEDLSDLEFEDGKQLFYDERSKTFFEAYPEDVILAEYEVNRKLFTTGGASLNDFYSVLVNNGAEIDILKENDKLGWSPGILESHYWASWIDFDHYKVELDDGMEYTIISMRCDPVIDYAYY